MAPPLITRIIPLVIGYWLLVIPSYAQPSPHIRVAIVQDASSLRLRVNGSYEVIDSVTNKVLARDKNLNTTVTVYANGILLGKIKLDSDKLLIRADLPGAINVDGRRFRGELQLLKKDNAHLLTVNYIGLEDYIKGILYHEASHYWPIEVLKAQAIACRTYAVYQIKENKSRDYDVTSDIYSQVYGGKTSERYRTSKAVEETKGMVLAYQGKAFPAYYHATCAGHTEDASLLWNMDIAPLKGASCGFCKDSPHFNWHLVLERGELRQRLVNAGHKMGMIKNIEILGKDLSGRIIDLKINTTTTDLRIPARDFRNIIGPNEARSLNFTVNLTGEDLVFEGYGWGHGVGMCQWGAYFMAKQGYTAEEILKYYYPGANIETVGF